MKTTTTIATKVTIETAEALQELAEAHGTTLYDMVLNAIAMVLRLGGKEQRMSPYLRDHWHVFEHCWGSKAMANLATLQQKDLDIQDAIYRVTQPGHTPTLIKMERPFFGDAVVTTNNEVIVADVLKTAYPSTYRVLRQIQKDCELESVMGVITWLVNQYASDQMDAEIRELFEDNERYDNGKSATPKKYVKHNKRNIDTQTSITFNHNDE